MVITYQQLSVKVSMEEVAAKIVTRRRRRSVTKASNTKLSDRMAELEHKAELSHANRLAAHKIIEYKK